MVKGGVTIAEIEKLLSGWKAANQRPAWKPRVAEGNGAPAGSRFGGPAWLPDGSSPLCQICQQPLPLLLQLDLGGAPGGLGPGLLQAFYCCDPDCEQEGDGWGPFSPIHLVRIVDGNAGKLAAPRETDHPAKQITGWDELIDLPNPEDHRELGLDYEYDFKANRVTIRCPSVGLSSPPLGLDALTAEQIGDSAVGDKLLGWPHWVQGAEYPACPQCNARMRYLIQLDSENGLPIMWGDAGIAHISQCLAHPYVLTMAWACS